MSEENQEECPFSHIEPVRNLFGRPTKLTKEVIEKAYKYIDRPLHIEVPKEIVVAGVGIQSIMVRVPNEAPTMVGLSLELGVSRETLYDWARKTSYFSDIINLLKSTRERFNVAHGSTGDYNAGFAKFLLINTTDYDDKKKVEHSADQDKPLSINIVKSDKKGRTLEDIENS